MPLIMVNCGCPMHPNEAWPVDCPCCEQQGEKT